MLADRTRARVTAPGGARLAFGAAAPEPTFTQEDIDAAYQRGYGDGGNHANVERNAILQRLVDRVDAAVTALSQTIARSDEHVTQEVLELAIEIATWLLRTELTIAPERLRLRVEDAVADVDDPIELYVAPAFVEVIAPSFPNLRVVGDPALAPGDLRFSAGDCTVDGRISAGVERLRSLLLSDVARAGS